MANCYTPDRTTGGVAESADAPDLKSGSFSECGFESHRPYWRINLQKSTFTQMAESPRIRLPGALAAVRQQ
jgi:hypothetical protein